MTMARTAATSIPTTTRATTTTTRTTTTRSRSGSRRRRRPARPGVLRRSKPPFHGLGNPRLPQRTEPPGSHPVAEASYCATRVFRAVPRRVPACQRTSSIENLCVSYGATRVLDHVSLDVERGEMIALLGSSGCGKTTLLRSIAGFIRPDSGAIRVDGDDITRAAAGKAQHGDDVPVLRAVAAHERRREHRLRACRCAAGRRTRSPRAWPRC